MTVEPRITALPNGLRVVSQNMPHLESAAIGVWVDTGARHEAAQLHGISHLLEHMAFKGTKRRSALAIAEEIEAVGGHVNAYTSRENTAYFIRVLRNDIPLAVDILADILMIGITDLLQAIEHEIIRRIQRLADLLYDYILFPVQLIRIKYRFLQDIRQNINRQWNIVSQYRLAVPSWARKKASAR